jgi:isocitrate dehydrogenase
MVDSKIKVDGVVVDLDGDEMTRIIWDLIKRKVSFIYLNLVNISIFRRNL